MRRMLRGSAVAVTLLGTVLASHPTEAQYTADYQTNIISGVVSNWSGTYNVGSNSDSDVLFIQNSGILSSDSGSVGVGDGADDNTVIVSGNGSIWNNSGNLSISAFQRAYNNQLIITNGGAVYDNYGTIGLRETACCGPGGFGFVLVTGTGSVWSNRYDLLSVEGPPSPPLTIADGGAVFNNNATIVSGALVTGTGSVWNVRGSLAIYGDHVTPSFPFTVSAGGFLQSGAVLMDSASSAIVTGTGSVWIIDGSLNVQGGGVTEPGSRLGIGDQGMVSAESAIVTLHSGITVSGGSLCVTNGLGTASINLNAGDLLLTGGTVTVDQLLVFNGGSLLLNGGTVTADQLSVNDSSSFVFSSGLLTSGGTFVTNGQNFAVGDGNNGAVFELAGGFHSFANGLTISSNASLTGCGTIDGSVVVDPGGTVLADCGEILSFTGIVTNNGSIVAVNGTFINFYGPVVNNGSLVATNGSVRFWSGIANNGRLVLDPRADADGDGIPNGWTQQYFGHPVGQPSDLSRADDDRDGDGMSNLQEYLAGTDPTNSVSYLHITSVERPREHVHKGKPHSGHGNGHRHELVRADIRVSWSAIGGKSYVVQTNSVPGAGFNDASPVIAVPGSGETTTNYLDVGGATNAPARFYRVRLVP